MQTKALKGYKSFPSMLPIVQTMLSKIKLSIETRGIFCNGWYHLNKDAKITKKNG